MALGGLPRLPEDPCPVGHGRAARDDHSYRSAVISLAFLEGEHAREEVGLRDAGGLQQLIESSSTIGSAP